MARNRKLLKVHRQRCRDGTIKQTFYTTFPDPTTGKPRRKYLAGTEAESIQMLANLLTDPATGRFYTRQQIEAETRDLAAQYAGVRAENANLIGQIRAKLDTMEMPPLATMPDQPSNAKRLSDALAYWKDWKRDTDGRSSNHLADVSRHFNNFRACVSNKPVDKLIKDDFVKWERKARRLGKDRSGKWIRDALSAPATVFRLVKRKTDWPFPAGLMEWTNSHDPIPYKPKADNKRALTPDEFGKLIAACREWETADPEQFPADTQSGRAMRLVAARKQREGIMLQALFHLAVFGFDIVDFEKLQWENLSLDTDPATVDLPRSKTEWKTGAPVPRLIPLLPEQVQALKKWKPYATGPFVFTSSRGAPYCTTAFSKAYAKLQKAAGVKTNFKHFRNIPGTVARNATLPDWLPQAVLGHTPTSVLGQHYCESPQPSALLPLVNLIGDAYFKTAGKKE